MFYSLKVEFDFINFGEGAEGVGGECARAKNTYLVNLFFLNSS